MSTPAEQRAQAEQVPCPVVKCGARTGEPCKNLGTGRPLERRPAHEARLWDAEALSLTPWPRPHISYEGA